MYVSLPYMDPSGYHPYHPCQPRSTHALCIIGSEVGLNSASGAEFVDWLAFCLVLGAHVIVASAECQVGVFHLRSLQFQAAFLLANLCL